MTVDLKKLQVLIVDDDSVFLDLLQAMLEALGITAITRAANGLEAVTKLKEAAGGVDCILCDYSMEHGNGLELLKAVRLGQLKHFRPDATVLLITASAMPGIVQTAAELDVSGYLVKPVTPDKLRNAIIKARSRYFQLDINKYANVVLPMGAA